MKPKATHKRLAQEILNKKIAAGLLVDGVFGNYSVAAAKEYIGAWGFDGAPTPERYVAAVIQRYAKEFAINSCDYDAFWGPDTEDAATRIIARHLGVDLPKRPDEIVTGAKSSVRCWSPTTAQMIAKYGPVGTGQTMIECPYPLRLDWDLDTSIEHFSAHLLLKTRIEAALAEILAVYGLAELRRLGLDRFGGCLNVRLKRGGSTYSIHSWGGAIDWYPSRNQLKQTKRSALFAKPEYTPFMDIWEKHGFMSLGRCFDFDWMHVQSNP